MNLLGLGGGSLGRIGRGASMDVGIVSRIGSGSSRDFGLEVKGERLETGRNAAMMAQPLQGGDHNILGTDSFKCFWGQ